MDWFNFKSILIAAIIFIPLERVLALRSKQKLFRRGWANDLFYLLANGFLIKIGLIGIIVAAAGLSNWLVPASIKVMVSSQPYWLQFAEILSLPISVSMQPIAPFTPSRGFGIFMQYTTALKNLIGWPEPVFTP